MPALNFQSRFVPAVENGIAELAGLALPHLGVRPKRQTIRKLRKVPIKAGDTLHLFTGMRTKKCRRLVTVKCGGACDITIGVDRRLWHRRRGDWRRYSNEGAMALARRDGFRDRHEMVAWFEKTHGLPFSGTLVRW